MSTEDRIVEYIQIVERLKRGEYDIDMLPPTASDDMGRLGQALYGLARKLTARREQIRQIERITMQINAGLMLDDILENVYRDFREIIPYNRIGFSLLEENGTMARARWAKSDQPDVKLTIGYAAPLAGSSLSTLIETGQPRIINDLVAYLEQKPDSESTRLIVEEGCRSSLTCPLIANGYPVGFIFFSSREPNAYSNVHIDVFQYIAQQLSIIVDKGQLVSELAERQGMIEAQNDELRHLNDLKNIFIGIAAHDLRNPIGAIQMMAQFMADPISYMPEQERTHLLNNMISLSQHMLTLLGELLDVAQIESGHLELHYEHFDLREFLADAVSMHGHLAANKHTVIRLEDMEPGSVQADPNRLRQVIDNLISNAVKFSPAGSMVVVRAQREESAWRVSVQDQGPGIKLEDRDRLFQDFARLSAQPTGNERSTGLGLAITRRVVEAHGGQLGVDSIPGQGATFWFTLPDS